MVSNTLHVSLSDKTKQKNAVSYKSISLRERLVRLLFGKKQKLMILIPGDEIEKLAITKTKGETDERRK